MAETGLVKTYEVLIKGAGEKPETMRATYSAEDLGDRYSLRMRVQLPDGEKATFLGYYDKVALKLLEAYMVEETPEGEIKQSIPTNLFPSPCMREGLEEVVEQVDMGYETITVRAGTFKCRVLDLKGPEDPNYSHFWFCDEEGPLKNSPIKGHYKDEEVEITIELVYYHVP